MLAMFLLVMVAIAAAGVAAFDSYDPASMQLIKQNTTSPIGDLSLSSGCPVQFKEATTTINTNLIRNAYLMDTINHFVTEVIPERRAHAKGTGAFGYFEVTHDVSDVCKAKFLNAIGKRTRVATRFSPIVPSRGGNDLAISVRGFSIKFYTEDGNYDMLNFNIPVFVFQDPVHFASFTHAVGPNPVTNTIDATTAWDFTLSQPQSLSTLMGFSSLGLPDSYGRIPGFSIHTMQLSNCQNETYFTRFYLTPDAGVTSFTPKEASKKGDPDYLGRELFNTIGRGNYPTWTVYIQPFSIQDMQMAKAKGIDIFDITRQISTEDFPLRPVGKLVLNENPKNYFADVEQLAFCPGNLVPGILGSPDKLFEARTLAYRAAHTYRLGVNFNKIPVNRPLGKIFTYNRNGVPPNDDNEGGLPNYYPNMFNGPRPVADNEPSLVEITQVENPSIDHITEYYQQLPEKEKDLIASNTAAALRGLSDELQSRVIEFMAAIDRDFGNRISYFVQIIINDE